jgi:8-oxo-dGTP pyrophosphatase MutT (NUDIX family)
MRRARILGYRLADRIRRTYWLVVRPQTFGVKCVVEHDGRWLMIRNTYGHRRWTFPGGGVNRGEATEVAVRREVREEVGIDLATVYEIGAYEGISKADDTVTCYRATVDSPWFEIDGVEVAEARWVDPDDVPQPKSPAVDHVIALLAGGSRRDTGQ